MQELDVGGREEETEGGGGDGVQDSAGYKEPPLAFSSSHCPDISLTAGEAQNTEEKP